VFSYTPGSYQNTSTLAITGLAGTVTDGDSNIFDGASLAVSFNGLAVDTTPPSIGVQYTLAEAIEGGPAIDILAATPSINDLYGTGTLTAASIVISNAQAGDELGIGGATSGSFDSGAIDYSFANGTLSLTGSASLADYESAIGSITFQDTGTDTTTTGQPERTFDITVSEGALTSDTDEFQIAIDRPPELSAGGTVTYDGSGIAIDPGLTVTDLDNDTITGGTISIASGFLAGDELTFPNQNGYDLKLAYDPADGVLNLTGDASAADYQAVLQSIGFSSSAADPTDGGADTTRTLDIALNEQSASGMTIPSNYLAVTIDVACYASGTRILTTNGEIPVESLKIGDMVITAAGTERPIEWIGHRAYITHFANANPNLLPILFKAGALGNQLPRRDLYVSPKHAMFIDNALIPAEYLVNGASIIKTARTETPLTYWHIELQTHDVLLAEGAPSETYIDDNNRNMFHNAHEYWAKHPQHTGRPAIYCAPRLDHGFELAAIRARLAEIAGISRPQNHGPLSGSFTLANSTISGWARNDVFPNAQVCLDIFVDNILIAQTLANLPHPEAGRHAFKVKLLPEKNGKTVQVRRSLDGAPLHPSKPMSAAA
jgi:hypothetical protein